MEGGSVPDNWLSRTELHGTCSVSRGQLRTRAQSVHAQESQAAQIADLERNGPSQRVRVQRKVRQRSEAGQTVWD